MASSAVTLIMNPICPFAQRAWITLLEKKVKFQMKEANLDKKEPWFTQIYKRAYAADLTSDGKVPILIHGNQVIAESDLISWYVAESFSTGTNLIPDQPFDRLRMRRFIQGVPGKLISSFYSTKGLNSKGEEEKKAVIQGINSNLEIIQKEIIGPYALGEQFTLADILLYPWFERWCVNESFYGIFIPKKLTKIAEFIKAVEARPSVQETKLHVSNEFYINGYKGYLKQSVKDLK